jgi:hypothetical protein
MAQNRSLIYTRWPIRSVNALYGHVRILPLMIWIEFEAHTIPQFSVALLIMDVCAYSSFAQP